jgi:hypothetical protein
MVCIIGAVEKSNLSPAWKDVLCDLNLTAAKDCREVKGVKMDYSRATAEINLLL